MAAELVDWDLAVATARRVAPAGPTTTPEQAQAVVAELLELAAVSHQHVVEQTGLEGPGTPPPAVAVDRPGWARNNAEGMRTVLAPMVDKLAAQRDAKPGGRLIGAVGSRATGLQAGALLGFLSTKVLGQYEVFLPPEQGPGRLSLVAPNIVEVERRLGVDPHDFRLWVCLHESCHRLQFTAVPWLRDHLTGEVHQLLEHSGLDDPSALTARLRSAAQATVDAALGRGERPQSLMEVLQTPEQREVLDRLTGLMSLLEGHAEHVMDGVGPDVVPTVAVIRERFDERRRERGNVLDRLLRRAFGLDAKARQYVEGRRFVDAAVRAGGRDGFNQVWTSPETLPSRAEIATPALWTRRVLGTAALRA